MTSCAWRLTRGPPRDLDPSGEGEAEERCQKLNNGVDEMRSESFVLQSSVLRESELTEQLESCAGSQTSKAQEKGRLSNRQLEEVKVECQEPLNAMTVQDSTVPMQKHLEDRMGSGQQVWREMLPFPLSASRLPEASDDTCLQGDRLAT